LSAGEKRGDRKKAGHNTRLPNFFVNYRGRKRESTVIIPEFFPDAFVKLPGSDSGNGNCSNKN